MHKRFKLDIKIYSVEQLKRGQHHTTQTCLKNQMWNQE